MWISLKNFVDKIKQKNANGRFSVTKSGALKC